MISLYGALLAVGVVSSSPIGVSSNIDYTGPSKLLERVLQQDRRNQPASPIGSCVFVCGDQLVETERCPDGACPVFDCRARAQSCPVR